MEASRQKILAIEVGNTRSALQVFEGVKPAADSTRVASEARAITLAAQELMRGSQVAAVVLAGVNPPVLNAVEAEFRAKAEAPGAEKSGVPGVVRLGTDVPVPIVNALVDDSTVGQDRLLCALAAYSVAEQACVVVDVGTAVTVDFVDGEGVFQGGVIAPGARMMLKALHEHTAALPELKFEVPSGERGPFGKDTKHAMQLGVANAIRGLVRTMIEQYSEAFGAYPQIIATGGDAGALFAEDDLVEHIVPDLQLLGIAHACRIIAGGLEAPESAPKRVPGMLGGEGLGGFDERGAPDDEDES